MREELKLSMLCVSYYKISQILGAVGSGPQTYVVAARWLYSNEFILA